MRSVNFLPKLISAVIFTVVLSAGIIGVSYAYFNSANNIDSDAVMGDIDVVFSDIYIDQDSATDSSCVTNARIVDNGKNIQINIDNAYPGYTSTIFYEVTNNGSVPVQYKVEQPYTEEDNPVQLDIFENTEYIKRNGGKSQGQIIVAVSDGIGECSNYGLYTELNFQQTIVEIR
ncbi:MAG: hypothetical protein CVU91_05820 [Firmicutes bacterium HGW-Firmicutes-16]|nr:MAG: hypothetical protein CVU91_05820 [Firmicutes bacterium HGW-Firmicutes-16]